MRRSARMFVLAGALIVGCKDPPMAPPPPPPPAAPTVSSVAVTGISSPGVPGATQQLTATATMSNNTTQNVTTLATWASSTPAVALVSVGGLVTAVGPGQTDVTATYQGKTGTFVITVAALPTRLVFTVQPGTTLAGSVITPAVKVSLQDNAGNVATLFPLDVTVAIGTNPGGGTLSGTKTVTATNGVATFSDLNINAGGTGYTLTASTSGLTDGTSAAFTITPGAASTLTFTVQPTNTDPGAAITPAVRVAARDIYGNVATSFTGSVTVALGANPAGGTLSGTTTVSAVAGIATFADLSIGTDGSGYTLAASASSLNSGMSSAFSVAPGIATRLAFNVQPSTTDKGAAIMPAVQVTVQNSSGGTVTGFVGNVNITLATNPAGAALSGTTTAAAVNGVAAFSDLRIDKVGTGFTLTASVPSLSPATSSAFNVVCGADCWSPVAPMPTARYGVGAGVINGVLYAVGGRSATNNLPTVEAYDPVANTWTSKAAMPTARSYPSVAVVNGILYAIGGLTASGTTPVVEAYDPTNNTWTLKAPVPTPRLYTAVGVVNGIIFLAGGLSGGPLSTVEAYDPATNIWTPKAALPTPRYVPAGGVVNGILYVAGGLTASGTSAVVEAFDPVMDTWSTKAPLPSARVGIGVGVANNILYAVGGLSGSTVLNTLTAYSSANNTWTPKLPMITARFDMGVGVINGLVYAVGGRTSSLVVGTNEVYKP